LDRLLPRLAVDGGFVAVVQAATTTFNPEASAASCSVGKFRAAPSLLQPRETKR
jgi:hypothetical protein